MTMKTMRMMLTLLLISLLLLQPAAAWALEYNVEGPDAGNFGGSTTIEPVTVVGGAATEEDNVNRSKDTALIPPPFGSPTSNTLDTGEYLTPNLVTDNNTNTTISGGGISVPAGGVSIIANTESSFSYDTYPNASTSSTNTWYTIPSSMYYSDGSMGRLEIPAINLSVKVFEGETTANMSRGVGHFTNTSCWDGNVGLAAHNRGSANFFGQIHTLDYGDVIIYETQVGTRYYEVTTITRISETDFSYLRATSENVITLITCVVNVSDERWVVQAREY